MCNPALAVMAVTAIASAATTVMGNNAQNKALEAQAAQANIKTQFDYDQLTNQATDVNDASAQEKLNRQLQTARQRGQVAVAQGDAGVGGNSSLMVMNNTIMQERMDMDVLEGNRAGQIRNINSTMAGEGIGAQGEYEATKAKTMGTGAQLMAAGMSGASGAASGYKMGTTLAKIGPGSSPIPKGAFNPRHRSI